MVEEYSLLTSTRYDPFLKSCKWNDDHQGPQPFLLLPYHLQRLISAAEAHEWHNIKPALTYSDLKNICIEAVSAQQRTEKGSTAFKVRITVSKERLKYINVTTIAVPAFSSDPTLLSLSNPLSQPEGSSPIRIYLDTEPTIPSIFTKTKTTFRYMYDHAKQRNKAILKAVPSGIGSDILIYNEHGEIMETTIFNIAFYRNSQWITPVATSGCLCGVMRRWLLENGRIREDINQILTSEVIYDDECVLLFNGVQGCRLGKLYR